MAKCEDYPCCGHTDQDPCERQWYDKPGAFDTSRPGNEHALCDHENGICEVEYDEDEAAADNADAGLDDHGNVINSACTCKDGDCPWCPFGGTPLCCCVNSDTAQG